MDQDNTLLNEGLNNSSEVPANEVSDILPTEENIPSEEITPEIPEINFAVLKTEEIVAEMQKLIETCPTGQIKEVMEKLPEIFEKMCIRDSAYPWHKSVNADLIGSAFFIKMSRLKRKHSIDISRKRFCFTISPVYRTCLLYTSRCV